MRSRNLPDFDCLAFCRRPSCGRIHRSRPEANEDRVGQQRVELAPVSRQLLYASSENSAALAPAR
jgi:hypothetical protein